MAINNRGSDCALTVMKKHLKALNSLNGEDLAKTLHFPHYRLVGTKLICWQSQKNYLSDFRVRAGEDWFRTEWKSITVQRVSPKKVHLIVEVNRFNIENQLIKNFDSFWVITFKNGKWAAQFRSSFADN